MNPYFPTKNTTLNNTKNIYTHYKSNQFSHSMLQATYHIANIKRSSKCFSNLQIPHFSLPLTTN